MALNKDTRGWGISCSSSRVTSHSSYNTSSGSKSSIDYAERMKAQSWANQMNIENSITVLKDL